MKKYWLHFITITKHKWFVMIECFKVGLILQGLLHDLSKYSLVEFFGSARYFQGDSTPIAAEKTEKGYSLSWLHHKGHNKHHFEFWIDWKEEVQYCAPIPDKYILEMACDMVGASKAYNKSAFSKEKPLEYIEKNKIKFSMMGEAYNTLERYLCNYADSGRLLAEHYGYCDGWNYVTCKENNNLDYCRKNYPGFLKRCSMGKDE
jgi:hypothetical protein